MTDSSKRLLIRADLQPVNGDRFQPTGFPDIGNATYERFQPDGSGDGDWVDCILVESAQSMANRLEATGWDDLAEAPVSVFDGLPYVRVVRKDGEYVTSSRTEAHRLSSAFIKDANLGNVNMKEVIKQRLNLGDDRPLAPREIASAIFALDPLCLIHGVFFAESAKVWPGQPKITRALTGAIDAIDVRRAESGGVKRDHVRHSIGDTGGSAEGYGSIPFHRTEWTARQISATFSLDRVQLRSYGLSDAATELLDAIAQWEIRSLLDSPLRLRTACDLEVVDDLGSGLRSLNELETAIRAGVKACAGELGSGEPLEVTWEPAKKGPKSDAASD